MSLAVVHTRAKFGIDAPLVSVEVHLSNGLPGLSIVGLPEAAVKESKDRVRSALINSQFEFPARRITIAGGRGRRLSIHGLTLVADPGLLRLARLARCHPRRVLSLPVHRPRRPRRPQVRHQRPTKGNHG